MPVRYSLVFVLCLAAGCGRSEPESRIRLADAISELGELGEKGDFVVIEAPDSDQFVEFRIAEAETLQTEFPVRTVTVPGAGRNLNFTLAPAPPEIKGREVVHLDQEELASLLDVIQLNGLLPKTIDLVALDSEKKPVSWIHSVVAELDRREPERSAEFAFDVFREVYGVGAVEGFVITRRIKK